MTSHCRPSTRSRGIRRRSRARPRRAHESGDDRRRRGRRAGRADPRGWLAPGRRCAAEPRHAAGRRASRARRLPSRASGSSSRPRSTGDLAVRARLVICRARRTRTTSASCTCASSQRTAAADRPAARRPVRPAAVERRRRARLRRATHARAAGRPRALVSGRPTPTPTISRRRSSQRNAARAAAQAAASRCAAVRRACTAPTCSRCSRAFWQMRARTSTPRWRNAAADLLGAQPPLAGPRVLLAGAPVDRRRLHAAIEAHGAVVVAEIEPVGQLRRGTRRRDRRRPDRGARRQVPSATRSAPRHAGRRRRTRARRELLDDGIDGVVFVAARPTTRVRLGLPARCARCSTTRACRTCVLDGRRVRAADRRPTRERVAAFVREARAPREARAVAEKQLESTVAAAAFQKEWFADLRRRVFDERSRTRCCRPTCRSSCSTCSSARRSATSGGRRSSPPNARRRRISTPWRPTGYHRRPVPLLQPRLRRRRGTAACRSRRGAGCRRRACSAPG